LAKESFKYKCSSILLIFDVALRTQDINNMSINFKLTNGGAR